MSNQEWIPNHMIAIGGYQFFGAALLNSIAIGRREAVRLLKFIFLYTFPIDTVCGRIQETIHTLCQIQKPRQSGYIDIPCDMRIFFD